MYHETCFTGRDVSCVDRCAMYRPRRCRTCGGAYCESEFYWDKYAGMRHTQCMTCFRKQHSKALRKKGYAPHRECDGCGGGPTERDIMTNNGLLSRDVETNTMMLCSDCILGRADDDKAI